MASSPKKSINAKWQKGEPLAFLQANIGFAGDECLIWPFSRTPYGYGAFGHESQRHYAHRWMCAAVHGPAPSHKHQAAHSCGNGHIGCVHPRHVDWKTPLQNSRDKIEHGTTYSGKGRKRQKLTREQVEEIRQCKSIAEQFEIAERFGISQSNVGKILYSKAWTKPKRFNDFSDDDVRRIRSLRGTGSAAKVAAELGIGRMTVYNIWSGKHWKHVS